MKFNFFSSSSSKHNPKPSSKFTSRQTQRAKPTEQPKPKAPPCPVDTYIPHHRNLGVAPDASAEEIKAAWRRLGLRLHPDKIRNPAMKDNATAAMILVNEAHEQLFKERGNWLLRTKNRVLDEIMMDRNEAERRRDEEEACKEVVRRKPWFWAYKTQKQCEKNGEYFCGEFWATVGHYSFTYPRPVSDWVWDFVDKDWRHSAPPGPPTERLTFYGPCSQTYEVMLPPSRAQIRPPRWSSFRNTPCNTSLFAGDAFPVHDVALLAILITILLFVFWRLFERAIGYAFDLLLFGILLNLWCVLWTGKKAFMLCTWPAQKLLSVVASVVRHIFRLVCGKLEEILEATKRYLYGTRILRLVLYLLELGQAWQDKGFSAREVWENKGFSVSVETVGRGGRRRARR